MPIIDDKVVKMSFDNKQFEKGVGESLKTLDDLKKALNFDKVEKSLSNIERAFNGVDLSGLSNSIDSIAEKFSPLGVIAVTTMQRITNAAIDAGKKVADAFLGFSDMTAGQGKYETQTKAVQTITNATGKSVEEVEKVLAKLQKYTDETSYDFAEMVNSIGKFTSVGVELERAERAMEGIASEAAKSGAEKAEANRAMYNFAQALSAGYVKLIDWKSIENANMATKEFKETLIDTAIEMGVLRKTGDHTGSVVKELAKGTKEVNVDFKSFNETLSDEWLTSDVLIATLEKYADTTTDFGLAAYHAAQEALTWTDAIDAVHDAVSSGWMQSFKYLFGDLDEARVMWTDVANALIEFTDIFTSWRNTVLEGWHELGGYNDMIEAAKNLWKAFMNIVKGVGQALTDVFPILQPENMTKALVDGTKKLKEMSQNVLEMFGLYEEVEEEEEDVEKKTEDITEKTEALKESVEGVSGATETVVQEMSALDQETQNVVGSLDGVKTGLKRGMRGESVKQMQKQLMKLGFRLDRFGADGIFGPETQAALKALQREIGVTETGVLDEATKAALQTEDALRKLQNRSKRGIGLGDRGDEVKKLQKELNKYLSDSEKLVIDGIFGPKTEAALKKFQKESGIKQTGAWDEATKAADRYRKMSLLNIDKINEAVNKSGNKKNGIIELQKQLIKAGYLVDQKVADGIYGPKTKEAVKQLQKDLGVEQTGEWDKVTAKAARAASATGKTMAVELDKISKKITSSSMKSDIKKLQDELVKTGYLADKSLANGVFGPETETAIKKLQKDLGVKQTGIWDKATVIALHRSQDIVKAHTNVYKSSEKSASATKKVIDQNKDAAAKTSDATNKTTIAMKKLQRIVRGWGAAIKIVSKFAGSIVEIFANIAKMFNPLVKQIIDIAYVISGMVINLSKELEEKGVYKSFVDNVTKAFGPLGDFIKTIADGIHTFLNAYEIFLKKIDSKTPGEHNTFTNFFEFLKEYFKDNKIINFVIGAFEAIKSVVGPIISFVIEKISDLIGWFSSDEFKQGKDNVLGWIAKQFENIKTEIDKFRQAHPELTLENFGNKLREIGGWISDKAGIGIDFIVDKFTKLSEIVSAFIEEHPELSLSNILGIFVDLIKSAGGMFKGFFEEGQQSESGTFFDELKTRIKAFEPVLQWFDGVRNKVVDFWKAIFGIGGETVDTNGAEKATGFIDILKTKLDGFSGVVDLFVTLKDNLVNAWKELTSIGTEDAPDIAKEGGLTTVFDKLGEFTKEAEKIDFGKLISTALKGLMVYGFLNIANGIKSFGKGAMSFGASFEKMAKDIDFSGISKAFKGILLNIQDYIKQKGKKQDTIGTTVLKIAGSLLMVAAAVALLSTIDVDQATKAMIPFVIVLGSMATAVILINRLSKNDTDGGKQALMLAGAVTVIAAALWMMCNTINSFALPVIIGAFVIIGAMVAGLGIIAVQIAKNTTVGDGGVNGLLQMCIGVFVLVLAFDKMIKVLLKNWDNPLVIVEAIAIIVAMVAGLGIIGVLLAKNSTGSDNGVSGLLGMCIGVFVLVKAFGEMIAILLANIDKPGTVVAAIAIIEVMLLSLGAIAIILSRSSNTGKTKVAGLTSLVTALSVLVGLFGTVVSIINKTGNSGTIWTAFVVIEVLLATLGAIAILMGKFGGGILGALSSTVVFIAMAFSIEKIVKVFGDVLMEIKGINVDLLKWFFIGIDAAMAILGGIVIAFGNMPVAAFIGSAGLLALLGVLAAGIDILSKVGKTAIERFAEAMRTLGWGMDSFNNSTKGIDLKRLIKIGEFLKDTLPEMVESVLKINTDGVVDKMKAIRGMGSRINLFATSLGGIKRDTLQKAENAKTLMTKTNELGQKINEVTIPGYDKLVSLFMFGTALNLYGTALSSITFTSSEALGNLVTNTNALLGIVNNTTRLDEVATSIQNLAGAIEIYFQSLSGKEIDESGKAVENTKIDPKKLKEKMNALVQVFDEEEIQQLSSYAGDDKSSPMYAVANGIANLGLAFGSYADNIGKLKPTEVSNANDVIDKINGITYDSSTITDFTGSFSDISGLMDGSVLAFKIAAVGIALKSYADNIGGLTQGSVKNANDVLDELIKVEDANRSLNTPKGVLETLQALFGHSPNFNLEQFTVDVEQVGGALEVYGDCISSLSWFKIQLATSVLEELLSVSNRIPSQDWWTTLLFGADGKLKNFGDNISKLGLGLKEFGNYINGATFDSSKIDTIFKENGLMHRLLGYMSDINALVDLTALMGGDRDWSTFSSGLGALGTNLSQFQTNVANFDANKVEDAVSTVERLIKAISGVPWYELEKTDLPEFAQKGNSKFDYIATGIATLFSNIADIFDTKDIGEDVTVSAALSSVGQKIADKIGTSIATADITGIKDGFATVLTEAYDGVKSSIDVKEDSYSNKFKTIGTYIDAGLVKGLEEGSSAVTEMAKQVALAAYNAACAELGVESPSKKFMWIGEMVGEGFVQGIENSNGDVADSLDGLVNIVDYETPLAGIADDVTNALSNSLGNVTNSDVFNGFANDMGDALSDSLGSVGNLDNLGAQASGGITDFVGNALTNSLGDLGNSELVGGFGSDVAGALTDSLGQALRESTDTNAEFSKDIGEILLGNMNKGLQNESKQKEIETTVYRLMQNLKTKFTDHYQGFVTIGRYIINGIRKGLWEGKNAVTAMAEQVAEAAYNAAKAKLGIQSPSKKFMWIGEMVGEGFANGMQSYSKTISSTAAGMSDSAVDSAKASAMKLYDAIGFGDGVDQPVIRPVLDLSDVQSGMKQVNGLFGTRAITATRSADMANGIAARQTTIKKTGDQTNEAQNGKLLDSATKMFSEKMDQMAEAMKDLKIYMDGNTLVGYVSPKVNRTLGQQAILANRLN